MKKIVLALASMSLVFSAYSAEQPKFTILGGKTAGIASVSQSQLDSWTKADSSIAGRRRNAAALAAYLNKKTDYGMRANREDEERQAAVEAFLADRLKLPDMVDDPVHKLNRTLTKIMRMSQSRVCCRGYERRNDSYAICKSMF